MSVFFLHPMALILFTLPLLSLIWGLLATASLSEFISFLSSHLPPPLFSYLPILGLTCQICIGSC